MNTSAVDSCEVDVGVAWRGTIVDYSDKLDGQTDDKVSPSGGVVDVSHRAKERPERPERPAQ